MVQAEVEPTGQIGDNAPTTLLFPPSQPVSWRGGGHPASPPPVPDPHARPPVGDGLGLDRSEVRLSPHNPDWVALGERECAAVAALLGDLAVTVVHVGSTAVPGLEAKPILDIVAAVGDRVRIDDVVARLCAGGDYAYEGDKRDDGGLLFVRGENTVRTVHIHVVGQKSRAWTDYLRFHALLRDDADARDRYQSAKRELARTFARDRPGYTKAKGAVVEELLASDDRPPTPHPR